MPTKRTRHERSALTSRQLLILGLGSGISSLADDELRALWRAHGAAADAVWLRRYGRRTFVSGIAEREGWADAD